MDDIWCCIGLCVYNNEQGLPRVLSNIITISKSRLFKKITVIAFYDNSPDSSYIILDNFRELCNRNRIHEPLNNINVIIVTNNKTKTEMRMNVVGNVLYRKNKSRTARIAHARNEILNVIRKLYMNIDKDKDKVKDKDKRHCDYFIMMDSNEYACVGQINIPTLESVMKRTSEWDSVSFNREAGYYDYWALSYDPYIYSFFHIKNSNEIVSKMRNDFQMKLNAALKKDGSYEFIPVYSSFNGFAIYKMNIFIECSYSANINTILFPKHLMKPYQILNNFTNDCEHRKFHLEAKKNYSAKIMVCPLSLFNRLPVHNPGLRGPA